MPRAWFVVLNRIPGPLLVWYSILVFGAASSIVRILADLGAQHTIDGRNAISFCNILFAGNICAVAVLFAVHQKEWNRATLSKLSRSDWFYLFLLALLANCIAPALFFIAIQHTMVTSVVLISQIEPPLMLLFAWLIFKERIGPWLFVGSAVCLAGIALSILLQPRADELMIGRGELSAGLAAVIYTVSSALARLRLDDIPLGIFSVFRNAVGTVAFFIAAVYLFGPEHFTDLTSPFLWQWMVLYGGIIVVTGQLAWDAGVRKTRSIDVSLATSFAPVAGVLGALFILGERPTLAHAIGGAVLLVGIGICLIAGRSKRAAQIKKPDTGLETEAAPALEAELRTGFKGV